MKRFMTFTGSASYASGGANDFLDSFDTADEAILAGRNACGEDNSIKEYPYPDDWWHVYDTEENKIIDGRGHALGFF